MNTPGCAIAPVLGLFLMAAAVPPAVSAVVINSTRVIYSQDDKEVTVQLNNKGKGPVLIQSWIDEGDVTASPDKLHVPFMLTPPVNRVEPGKSQAVRIRYIGNTLPDDRESMFWFNALEIPAKVRTDEKESHNYIQMAFRTRIKIFFRPIGLKGIPEDAAKALLWKTGQNNVTAVNNSPWFVSLVAIDVTVNGKKQQVEGESIPPFGTHSFTVKGGHPGGNLSWSYVNDYGAIHSAQATLTR